MGNFRDFLPFVFYTKPPENNGLFLQKVKTQGTKNTFGKFQSIWMLTSAGNEDLKTIYNVKFL